ncbi:MULTISPECIES: hypothetical protein [unclassified Sphingobium]|uniref:hypothetical protein n=1 Tax=unclassified Sphingobium TaxID=2611147 RepID=UPI000A738AF8|nr:MULTISPECIES: hypothetical protein [unclassified Sphingobium]
MSGPFSNDIISMIISLHNFVERYTGDAAVGEDANYLVNNAGVVNNSLHYESGRGSYLPSNAATSESQVLLALGYIRAYEATGIPVFKERAIKFTDAYLENYFPAYSLPISVGEWRHHWVINGKYPFKVLGPVDTRDYQQSGSFDLVVNFEDGIGFIPHGAPNFGEQTARVYFAYGPVESGKLLWKNVFADLLPDTGDRYAVDYFIDSRLMKMDANGVELGIQAGETAGKIKLVDSFTGQLKVVSAARTGATIARNAGFDAWPMWRKLGYGECASAMDVELWHIELFKAMYDNTGDTDYLRAFNSAAYSLDAATTLEPETHYFKRNLTTSKPFKHGISYYSLSNTTRTAYVGVDRGYSTIMKYAETGSDVAELEIAQTGVFNRVTPETVLNCEMLLNSPNTFCDLTITVSPELGAEPQTFSQVLLADDSLSSVPLREFKLKSFYRKKKLDGSSYLTIDQAALLPNSGAVATKKMGYVDDRLVGYASISLPSPEAYCVIGFWNASPASIGLDALTYRVISGRCAITIQDADGWIWGKELAAATGAWGQYTLAAGDLTPWPYQNNTGRTPSTFPTGTSFNSFSLAPIPETGPASLDIYCYGDEPTTFDLPEAMLTEMKIKMKTGSAITARFGDIYVSNNLPIAYKYSPGVVPFTTDKAGKEGTKFWRGTPYVAYQYPSVWAMLGKLDHASQVLDFYRDSQDDYEAKSGLRGPFSQVYIWPKWDNIAYGQAEGFSATGPDPNTYWGGFQARSFNGAASLLLQMQRDGNAIPAALYEVVDDYAAFLVQFLRDNVNKPPTLFAQDGSSLPIASYDEPHIAALHINALSALIEAGHSTADIVEARERSLSYLHALFCKSGDMKGSFSPSPSTRMFYGFWVGEIIRALSSCITVEDQKLRAQPSTVAAPDEMEFEEETFVTLETGEVLAFDKPVVMPPIEMEFADQVVLTTEAGDALAFE